MLNQILEKIQSYDSIVIFRHVLADMDAIGSQFGMKQWIMDTFPEKEVYCLGDASNTARKVDAKMDIVDDEVIRNSLAIVLDTANIERIEDDRLPLAKESIRIDHHVKVASFCDIEWVDEKACAASEMVATFLNYHNQDISKECATYLYNGLVADSIRFTTSNVRKESLLAAAYLISKGVNVVEVEQANFSSSYDDYLYETKVREKSVRNEKFLSSIMEIADYEACHLGFSGAKEKVYALSGIDSIEIWALFTRMSDGIHYSASLRSRRISVREIAQKFGGGGHVCACGIKNLTIDQVHEIIKECTEQSLL